VSESRSATRVLDGRALRTGLIAGAVTVYLAVTGVLERFNTRNVITGFIELGELLVLLVMIGAGYLAARKKLDEHNSGPALVSAAMAGVVAGATLAAFLLVVTGLQGAEINVREIFLSVTPRLTNDILSFGQSSVVGAAILLAIGLMLGALGGALAVLPVVYRRPVMMAVTVMLVVGLMEGLINETLDNLRVEREWLYSREGLTLTGAIVVFVVAGIVSALWIQRGQLAKKKVAELPAQQRKVLRTWSLVVLIALLVLLPQIVGRFNSNVLGTVGLYVLLGLGLNIVVGYAGLLDLGYVAFFAVGAYATGIFTSPASFLVAGEAGSAQPGFTNFWVALPLVVVVAVVIGVLIGAPVLRLRGDYLAIVTLGFGEIIRTLVLSDWLAPFFGGAQGLVRVPAAPPASLDLRRPERIYYLILAFVLIAAFVSARLANSRVGRAWNAMREDESVAEAMGVSVIKYKLLAFAMGAAIGCLGGAFFAAKIGSIFPNTFGLVVSINVLAVIILGGMGSIPGVVVGALVLVGIPDLLREVLPPEFRLLAYGAILVAIMIYRPEGLVPNVRRRRELHQEELEEEQYERRAGEDTFEPGVAVAAPGPATEGRS
jgi:branched-chain amino acid transport system permease protein